MAFNILTSAQSETCILIKQECCTDIPSYESNITDLLAHMKKFYR